MQFKDFEYFLAVHKYRSFSKAAESLYIAQPALSRYISNLESRLNVRLFDRKQVPVCLTPAGVRFLYYAKKIENIERQLTLEFSGNNISGHIDLGVPPLLGDYIIPRILPVLKTEQLGVTVDIVTDNTEPLKKMLLANKLDLAILSSPIQAPEAENQILMNDPIYLLINREHPVARAAGEKFGTMTDPLPVSLSQFQNELFILLHPEKQFHKTVNSIFDFYDFKPYETISVPNMNIAVDLVHSGMGVSFGLGSMLNRCAVQDFFCSLPDKNSLPVPVAFFRQARDTNPALRAVLECMFGIFDKG